MKFACGVLVKNVTTNEDGRVIETYQENDAVMYMVCQFPLMAPPGCSEPGLHTGPRTNWSPPRTSRWIKGSVREPCACLLLHERNPSTPSHFAGRAFLVNAEIRVRSCLRRLSAKVGRSRHLRDPDRVAGCGRLVGTLTLVAREIAEGMTALVPISC